jgi:hypothetical protein
MGLSHSEVPAAQGCAANIDERKPSIFIRKEKIALFAFRALRIQG